MPPNRTSCVPPLLTTVLAGVAANVICCGAAGDHGADGDALTNCEPEKIVAPIAVPPSTS